ncbi:MAG: hypothetical protein ABSA62_12040, partial [Methyloceanibacter sp.]
PVTDGGTRLLIPPATRYAIAVTMPASGDLILEMPPRGGGATARTNGSGAAADMCKVIAGEPAMTAAFMPFGTGYRGGVSLATGWLTGSLGGAERIVVGQLSAPGTVKVYSSGSALQGGPAMYLHSAMEHSHIVDFTEAASLNPFGDTSGVRVATTSTTTGADLLVSGVSSQDKTAQVRKYQLVRPNPDAVTLQAVSIAKVVSAAGSLPNVLGGD